MMAASYILPIRRRGIGDVRDLTDYLRWLDSRVQLIVVDGSPADVFAHHEKAWAGIRHVPPSPHRASANGKVAGVLTGLDLAGNERVVIADDDVRYNDTSLAGIIALLDEAEVVRPQNYFDPLPWHARWDSARSLLNRVTGGDWPGTLAVRRSLLQATRGYSGDCLFENLELVRTVKAAGGRELVASGVFVPRRPPDAAHFLSQRVRQAYDEFARPSRMVVQLALLPTMMALARTRPRLLPLIGLTAIAMAEVGRRSHGADQVFPLSASLLAPLWLVERAICSWLAVGSRALFGGVVYGDRVIARAATPRSELTARIARQADAG